VLCTYSYSLVDRGGELSFRSDYWTSRASEMYLLLEASMSSDVHLVEIAQSRDAKIY